MKLSFTAFSLATLGFLSSAAAETIVVLLRGDTQDAGTLDSVNAMMGTSLDPANALPGTTLESAVGCTKTPMLDALSEETIGDGVECMYTIQGQEKAFAYFIWFKFAAEDSVLTTATLSSVGPMTQGVGDGPLDSSDTSSPSGDYVVASLISDTDNLILEATGVLQGTTGAVRQNGAFAMASPTSNALLSGTPAHENIIYEIFVDRGVDAPVLTGVATAGGKKVDGMRRMLRSFYGPGVNVGTLDDLNAKYGTSVTVDNPDSLLGCFEIDMIDVVTRAVVGSGIDCLFGIDGGVEAVTSYEWANGDWIITAGTTSLASYSPGFGDNAVTTADGAPIANTISAAFSDGSGFLVAAGGGLEKCEGGSLRLSGSVRAGENMFFNCNWELVLVNCDGSMGGGGGGGSSAFGMVTTAAGAIGAVAAAMLI